MIVYIGVGRKLTRFLRASLGYAYVDSQLSDVNSSSTTDSIFYQDSYKKSSFSFGLSYDNTDDYYVPRHGIVLSDTIEYAGIGGTVEMLKNTFRFSYYKGLEEALDYDLILRYNLKVAGINDEGFVPVNERLFMGGVGSVRGYESYSISPRDSSDKRIGGFAMLTTSIAASVPLIPEAKLRGALFYDYGTMGTTWFNDIQRSSTGFAVEWFSPMGPIQLIFAKPLDDKANDRLAKFEFTIGQRF
jgi:outer membrane protein insertion porin family